MKITLGIAATALAAAVACWPAGYGKAEDKPAAPAPGAPDLDNLPGIVFDDSVGDWVVDRFAGNTMAGSWFYQGPALEVGGLRPNRAPGECVATPDGTVYVLCALSGGSFAKLVEVAPDGTLRLLMGDKGLIEGPMELCRAGHPIWNPKEKTLYLAGLNCLRKVVQKPDGSSWVEVVAGIPNKPPTPPPYGKPYVPQDGPAREATFQSWYRGAVCNSRGTVFWLEDRGLRRIENGTVSSVPLKFSEKEESFSFIMRQNLLSLGENNDTLYISDNYGAGHQRILRCDLKTGQLTRVCGINPKAAGDRYKRYGREADGPALTHASDNSGIWGHYDPFHRALWINGPDAKRIRWLKLDGDGWVRTVIGALRPEMKPQRFGPRELNGAGVPAEQFISDRYNYYAGTDSKGGLYIIRWTDTTGVWRAYNRKEVKP
ncbi:MAG TPA: hypothetical protein VNE39_08750 [Planctomycetota bacterium]|nr:hypothetical protein [Planctomycetota bacterium]